MIHACSESLHHFSRPKKSGTNLEKTRRIPLLLPLMMAFLLFAVSTPASAIPEFLMESVKNGTKKVIQETLGSINVKEVFGLGAPKDLVFTYEASPNKLNLSFSGGAFEFFSGAFSEGFKGEAYEKVTEGNETTLIKWWSYQLTVTLNDDVGTGKDETDIVSTSGRTVHLISKPYGGVQGDPLTWDLSMRAIDEPFGPKEDGDNLMKVIQNDIKKAHRVAPDFDILRDVALTGTVAHVLSGDVRHEFQTYQFNAVAEHVVPEPSTVSLLAAGFLLLIGVRRLALR